MKNVVMCAILSTAALLPFTAFAAPLDCPETAVVFAETNGSKDPISLSDLSQQVGRAESDSTALYEIAEELRSTYPKASDAEVSDLLITGYCHFLNTKTPENTRTEAEVMAFEHAAYVAAFRNAPPRDHQRRGWLYGN